jgi:hypothetical protein
MDHGAGALSSRSSSFRVLSSVIDGLCVGFGALLV